MRYEIPLSATPQTLSIALGSATYSLTLTWCDPGQCWTLAISDTQGAPILSSVPLVTGTDLLAPYAYLNFGGQLVAFTDNAPAVPPTFQDLGTTGHLYFVTTP